VKTSTHRIPEKPKVNPTVQKDSLQTSKKDSLKFLNNFYGKKCKNSCRNQDYYD
jgi:hypothetical protein